MPVEHRVALVTGAGSGIGQAIAVHLGEAGYRVGVLDLNIEAAENTTNTVTACGAEAMSVECDVRAADSMFRAVDQVVTRFGRLDVAVNNAGLGTPAADVADLAEMDWDLVIDVDLKGVWLSMTAQIPHMLASGGGSIVNIASVLGLTATDKISPAYVAAKHGVVGLTKCAALQYATRGVRFNAVCPGTIDTPGTAARMARNPEVDMRRELARRQAMDRLGSPEEVAAAVLWLGSDASSFVTGVALAVDGGWTAR